MTAAPENYPGSATQSGPRKETARITILPQPPTPSAPTVKMAKTQPLQTAPAPGHQTQPVVVAPQSEPAARFDAGAMLDSVPLPICWTIFGISALTLLIQIWNYFSS